MLKDGVFGRLNGPRPTLYAVGGEGVVGSALAWPGDWKDSTMGERMAFCCGVTCKPCEYGWPDVEGRGLSFVMGAALPCALDMDTFRPCAVAGFGEREEDLVGSGD